MTDQRIERLGRPMDPQEICAREALEILRELRNRVEVLEMAVRNLARARHQEENDGR